MRTMTVLAVAVILFVGCAGDGIPVGNNDAPKTCGRVAGPCCAQDVCGAGLTCVSRDNGIASHTCFTVETSSCGGAGEPCCAVKENASGLPVWCLAGLGCGTDGTCN